MAKKIVKQTRESFWVRVNAAPNGCWEWTGACNNTGYGNVGWEGKTYCAHRLAAFLVGMVDCVAAPKKKTDKRHVLHKCDNRKCCNPDHFFLGNMSDNQLDCYAKGRANKARGAKHTNAKLTAEQAAEIRFRYAAEAVSQKELGAEYGVTQGCISHLIRGETYL